MFRPRYDPCSQWRLRCFVVAALASMALHATAAPRAQGAPSEVDLLNIPSTTTHRGERRLLLQLAAAGSRLVAVGQGGLIIRSNDGGKSWQQSKTPASVLLTGVTFVNERKGWAVGHDGLILSTQDGGSTWVRQFDGEQANAQMLAAARRAIGQLNAAPGRGQEFERRLEQAETRLADAESASEAGPSLPLLGVAFISSTTGYAVGAFGQAFETQDGGVTWTYFGDRIGNNDGLHLNAVGVLPNGDMFIAGEAGRLFRSLDRGRTWQAADTGYGGHLYGVLAGSGAVRIAYGFKGHVFRSTDGGSHWVEIKVPVARTLVDGFSNAQGLWLLAQDGRLLHSTDDGLSFALSTMLPGGYLAGVLPIGSDLITVGVHGIGLGRVAQRATK